MEEMKSPIDGIGLPGQFVLGTLCCFQQFVQKIVRDMLGDKDEWAYTRGRASPFAHVRVYNVFKYSSRVR